MEQFRFFDTTSAILERCVAEVGMRTRETTARPFHVVLGGLPLGKSLSWNCPAQTMTTSSLSASCSPSWCSGGDVRHPVRQRAIVCVWKNLTMSRWDNIASVLIIVCRLTIDPADDPFLTDCWSCSFRRFAGSLCPWRGLALEGASHSIICTLWRGRLGEYDQVAHQRHVTCTHGSVPPNGSP